MTLTLDRSLEAMTSHAERLAVVAAPVLDRPVAHCPGWNVAELLRHLIRTHWFWATIVDERLEAPPTEGAPGDIDDGALIERFLEGATRLTAVLRASDQSASVYTWAPAQHNIAFVTRHQIQEIAVHHWDAADAAGTTLRIEPDVAADAVEEFLTFSVSCRDDPADPPRPALSGELVLESDGPAFAWTVSDDGPGLVRFQGGAQRGAPALRGSPSEILLWCYRRLDLEGDPRALELGERFRALSYTD